jgi:4-hydroxy-tetrahydrodipicolinate reductase
MIRVIINGAKGRMGQALIACAPRHPEIQVAGLIDLGDDLNTVISQADVVIDFSFHSATAGVALLCAQHRKALVIGTTGQSDADQEIIREQAKTIPMVWASNFSTGVNTLFWLTQKAAEILGPEFDMEVIEMHHRFKKDAPSGTATTLAQILAQARNQPLSQIVRHGRQGITGERTRTEIGIHSLRGGDVVGDHTVVFAALGERLELIHRATSRETLANGALRAAVWVSEQKPGLYSMQDVLGLR